MVSREESSPSVGVWELVTDHVAFEQQSLVSDQLGAVTLRLLRIGPGGVGPVPKHRHEAEHVFVVCEGRVTIVMEGGQQSVLDVGEWARVPGQCEHQVLGDATRESLVIALKLLSQ